MITINYTRKQHLLIVKACVHALTLGKIIAYPTDTSYGLAADAGNIKAIKKLYKIKERQAKKPVSVIVPSLKAAREIADWNSRAAKLAKAFWPGPLTLVLGLKVQSKGLKALSAKTGFIGVRMPKNNIALDLAKYLKRPITTTSANPSAEVSGGYDSYSAEEVLDQFKGKKLKPDIVINAGRLPKHKPSTMVRISESGEMKVLRPGHISENRMQRVLKAKK